MPVQSADIGLPLLRLGTGITLVPHGYPKLLGGEGKQPPMPRRCRGLVVAKCLIRSGRQPPPVRHCTQGKRAPRGGRRGTGVATRAVRLERWRLAGRCDWPA